MDKHEKMNQIKEYISRIEEDLNTSVRSDKETITNKNILQCMKYISELLEETINESSGKTSQSGKRFFITEEQRSQLKINGIKIIKDIVNELNRVTLYNNTQKIENEWITNWLIDVGMLKRDSNGYICATQHGNEIGIISRLKIKRYNNLYSEDAQKFIYDNIDNIITFYYGEN